MTFELPVKQQPYWGQVHCGKYSRVQSEENWLWAGHILPGYNRKNSIYPENILYTAKVYFENAKNSPITFVSVRYKTTFKSNFKKYMVFTYKKQLKCGINRLKASWCKIWHPRHITTHCWTMPTITTVGHRILSRRGNWGFPYLVAMGVHLRVLRWFPVPNTDLWVARGASLLTTVTSLVWTVPMLKCCELSQNCQRRWICYHASCVARVTMRRGVPRIQPPRKIPTSTRKTAVWDGQMRVPKIMKVQSRWDFFS